MQKSDAAKEKKPLSESVMPLWFDGFKKSGFALFRKSFSREGLIDLREYCLKNIDFSKIKDKELCYVPLKTDFEQGVDFFCTQRKVLPLMDVFFPRRYFMITSNCIQIRMPNSTSDAVYPGHPDLFSGNISATGQLPHFEITVCTPLSDLGLMHAGVRAWTGFHLLPYVDRQQISEENSGFYDCFADLGDSFLLDTRLPIRYLNNTDANPCLTLMTRYSIPWFRNFDTNLKLPKLTVSADEYKKIDSDLQFLFDHATGRRDWRQFPFGLSVPLPDGNGAEK